jgi:hypothetical protein
VERERDSSEREREREREREICAATVSCMHVSDRSVWRWTGERLDRRSIDEQMSNEKARPPGLGGEVDVSVDRLHFDLHLSSTTQHRVRKSYTAQPCATAACRTCHPHMQRPACESKCGRRWRHRVAMMRALRPSFNACVPLAPSPLHTLWCGRRCLAFTLPLLVSHTERDRALGQAIARSELTLNSLSAVRHTHPYTWTHRGS